MKNILKYTSAGVFSAISFVGCTTGGLSKNDNDTLEKITTFKTLTKQQDDVLNKVIKNINFKALVEKKLCATGDKKNDQACISKNTAHFANPKDREAINKKTLDDLRVANSEDNIAAKDVIRGLKELFVKSNDKTLSSKTMIDEAGENIAKCVTNNFKHTVVQKLELAPAPTEAKPEAGVLPEAPKEPVVPSPAPMASPSKSCYGALMKQDDNNKVYLGDEKPPVEQPKPVEGVKVEEHNK